MTATPTPTTPAARGRQAPGPGQTAGSGQGIVLRTGFFALDWTVRFTRTTVAIDGNRHEVGWGERYFPLELGTHHLQVSYQYLWLATAGRASLPVDVAPDQVVRVSYRAPRSVLVAFLPGRLTVET